MKTVTLARVARAVQRAHDYCSYYPGTNETIGPHQVNNLEGPSTGRYYDQCREWNTEIAVALAETAFAVDLSRYEIVNSGPWRDTVHSICEAVNAERQLEAEYQQEVTEAAE